MVKTTNYIKKQVRVALYVRVSTQEQAKEGYSIKEQIDRRQMCDIMTAPTGMALN